MTPAGEPALAQPQPADIELEFARALADAGLEPHDGMVIPADGRLHRFRVNVDKPGRRNGWAVLFADSVPHGIGGSWRTGARIVWTPESATITVTDRTRFNAIRREREQERAKAAARAATKAAALWERLPPAPADHPYLIQKNVEPGPCRVTCNNALVVPVVDATTGAMMSLQFIRPDSNKRFLAGGRTSGGCCIIGGLDGSNPAVIAEGYATSTSIREGTGWPVVVAFNAGNLRTVAKVIRAKHPDRDLIEVVPHRWTGWRPS